MVDIRMLQGNEIVAAIQLSDSTFRDTKQPSMAEAFPHIFADSIEHLSFGAFEDGKLISFMGLVPWVIRIGEARLRVFSLGSVCTHPDAQGRGIATQVLHEVLAYIEETGASLLLVSGNRSLYTRVDCVPFGRIHRYALEEKSSEHIIGAAGSSAMQIRELHNSDLFAIHELATQRPARYELGVNELSSLLKAEAYASCVKMKHRVLVSEQMGKVTAFAVIGVPLNPQHRGVVVEQAGEPEAVVQLAKHAVKSFDMNGLDFPVSWHETELHTRLNGMVYSVEDDLGTLRIVDGAALIDQLQPWLIKLNPSMAGRISLEETKSGGWLLTMGQESKELTAKELVCLLFDCVSEKQRNHLEAESLKGMFPVPFPFTGGLSYI